MSESAVRIEGLKRRFGTKTAVRQVDLTVPKGSVFGLLGPNGAGKSTTIKMMMGLLPSNGGSISMLGHDPEKEGIKVRQKVGYVPEHHGFYEWMSVEEIIALVSPYHKNWNRDLCQELMKDFRLERDEKVGSFSKGMRAKLALLLALSFEPEMLVLDEPTGGLDPAARRNFIETILSRYQETGKTIFVSSHLLNEFSGLLDHVAFMREGVIELSMKLEDLHAQTKRARLIFSEGVPADLQFSGALAIRKNGREAVVSCQNFDPVVTEEQLRNTGAEQVIIEDMSLEDIFVDMVGS
jgi:ABC-2 type transport system ATP-binding protein